MASMFIQQTQGGLIRPPGSRAPVPPGQGVISRTAPTQNAAAPAPTQRIGFGAGMTSPFLAGGPGVGSFQPGRVVSQTSTPQRSSREQEILASLSASLQQQQQSFNESSDTRYTALLKQFKGVKKGVNRKQKKAGQAINQIGREGTQRIDDARQQALASSQQSLMSRGLGNTTITSSANRGINADAERAQQSLGETLAGQRAGLFQQQAGQTQSLGQLGIDTSLSRRDVAPDMNTYLQLIQQLSGLRV